MRFHHFVQATLFLSQNVAHVKPKAARPCYSTIQTLSWSRPARGAIHWPETAGKNTVSLLIIIMARYGKAGLTQRTIQIDLTFIGFYWYHIYIYIHILYHSLSMFIHWKLKRLNRKLLCQWLDSDGHFVKASGAAIPGCYGRASWTAWPGQGRGWREPHPPFGNLRSLIVCEVHHMCQKIKIWQNFHESDGIRLTYEWCFRKGRIVLCKAAPSSLAPNLCRWWQQRVSICGSRAFSQSLVMSRPSTPISKVVAVSNQQMSIAADFRLKLLKILNFVLLLVL